MTNAQETVNYTADSVLSEIEAIDSQIESLKQRRLGFETDLNGFIGGEVAEQLKDKDYGAGTANVETNDFKVKVVVSKKVKWDQDELKSLALQIANSGEDPAQYIKVSYDVSETAYKAWPEKISKAFEPARTVETSKPKVTFERKK
jgi:hypothetical protein